MSAGAPRAHLLHQDESILVFDKPAGLAVQGGSGIDETLETQAAVFAKSKGRAPKLVHRLDRDTSGVIVMARTKPAAAMLAQAFATRAVEKVYCAIVCAVPEPRAGRIDLPLRKQMRKGIDLMRIASPDDPAAQDARTRYATLAEADGAALVELHPETGRMHQLRAHLAAIGAPIAGDLKYGGLTSLGGVAIPRLMLHARALRFPHPHGGAAAFTAPPPADFQNVLKGLGLTGM